MSRKIPAIDYDVCLSCVVCVTACPFSSLNMSADGRGRYGKTIPELARPETCTGCGLCVQACPLDCIVLVERG